MSKKTKKDEQDQAREATKAAKAAVERDEWGLRPGSNRHKIAVMMRSEARPFTMKEVTAASGTDDTYPTFLAEMRTKGHVTHVKGVGYLATALFPEWKKTLDKGVKLIPDPADDVGDKFLLVGPESAKADKKKDKGDKKPAKAVDAPAPSDNGQPAEKPKKKPRKDKTAAALAAAEEVAAAN